ncbi:MAG TPA: hypothetical protein VN376_06805 [Longilinea sp.]|nr:hypothetical protein [Longilinea sp.]
MEEILLDDGEVLIKRGDASIEQKNGLVRGVLNLTNKRLVFQWGDEIPARTREILLSDVRWINPEKILGMYPGGMNILLSDGHQAHFNLRSASDWINHILEARLELGKKADASS